MTEEIMIDGINVAGCKYYHYKGCTANNFGKCDSCSEIYKNCYYKQLKRLEQENEELKEKIEDKPLQCLFYNNKQNKCALFTKTVAYHCALEEIRKETEKFDYFNSTLTDASNIIQRIREVIDEIN